MIDNQKSIEFHPLRGIELVTIGLADAQRILAAWMALDPKRRGYLGDNEFELTNPHYFISFISYNGSLTTSLVTPERDGRYNLYEFADAFGVGMLKWGEDIGEEAV